MSDWVAIFLPNGRCIALSPEALRDAMAAAESFGLGPIAVGVEARAGEGAAERLMTSEQLAEVIGVHSTTVEAMAKSGAIPSVRCGKALRFEPAAVKAALRARRANDHS
jgi:excisionase family DNA binding protein